MYAVKSSVRALALHRHAHSEEGRAPWAFLDKLAKQQNRELLQEEQGSHFRFQGSGP